MSDAASAPAAPALQCPACRGTVVRRSHRIGLAEHLHSLAGRYPYRCHTCQARFLLAHKKDPATHAPSPRRLERVKSETQRKRRMILLFLAGLALFLLFAWKFILQIPAQNQSRLNPPLKMPASKLASFLLLLIGAGFSLFTAPLAGQTQQPPPAARATPFADTASSGVNLPVQRIGPNDLLAISVYDAPEFTRTVRVSADGQVILPLMRHSIPAAGLLPSELEPRLAAALRDEDLLNDATVIVNVAEYNSRPVTVTGAVRNPQVFQAVGRVRLMDAITRAGGIAPEAGSIVDVVSPDGMVRKIPLKPLLDSTTPELNVDLLGGEEVRVPGAGRVYILGNVKTSGAFPIQDPADSTVLKFLTLTGGLNSVAPKQAYIVREDPDTQVKRQIEIPLKDIVERKSPDVPLMAHDIVYIPVNSKHQAALNLEKIVSLAAGSAIFINVAK